MGKFLDSVPVSAIVRIRDMMYTVKDPFRLDQGDVSFDAPDTFKQAVAKAMAENRTHYLPSSGIPPLRKAFAEKMRKKNGIPIGSDDEVIVTNGGTHGLFAVFQAILEPGDEVIIPDPEWPPTMAIVKQAGGVPVQVPLREDLGFRRPVSPGIAGRGRLRTKGGARGLLRLCAWQLLHRRLYDHRLYDHLRRHPF